MTGQIHICPDFDFKTHPAFNILEPEEQHAPFVINSPHSGKHYPASFLAATKLSHLNIRKSEDFLVDELFAGAQSFSLPILAASFPRAYLDANREPYELDPSLFNEPLPDYANQSSIRVTGGLGTIARIVAEGEEIYREKIGLAEGLQRIEKIYKPYHATLRQLLAKTHVKFGHAVLLDCHSMPSMRTGPTREFRPDFVLGDRYATSCSTQITHYAKLLLQDLGYHVEVNKPYAGGFITEHYGRPQSGLHALQIEINRSLYMDEIRIRKSSNFDNLRRDLTQFLEQMINFQHFELDGTQPLAAE